MRNCRSGEEVEIFDSEALDKGSVYTGWDLVAHTLYEWRFGMNGGLYDLEGAHRSADCVSSVG